MKTRKFFARRRVYPNVPWRLAAFYNSLVWQITLLKAKMGFPASVADVALVKCGRRCCLCRKFCGVKIELHHIVQPKDGGTNTLKNCIPLCHDCHTEVNLYNDDHPRGKKFNPKQLRSHRDKWYKMFESGWVPDQQLNLHGSSNNEFLVASAINFVDDIRKKIYARWEAKEYHENELNKKIDNANADGAKQKLKQEKEAIVNNIIHAIQGDYESLCRKKALDYYDSMSAVLGRNKYRNKTREMYDQPKSLEDVLKIADDIEKMAEMIINGEQYYQSSKRRVKKEASPAELPDSKEDSHANNIAGQF